MHQLQGYTIASSERSHALQCASPQAHSKIIHMSATRARCRLYACVDHFPASAGAFQRRVVVGGDIAYLMAASRSSFQPDVEGPPPPPASI